MHIVTLRRASERPVVQRHPWVFSGAIAHVTGNPADGAVVEVQSAGGEWLARGTWSSQSQIRVRLFSWAAAETLDADLLRRRLARAIAARQPFDAPAATFACRLVYAEADGLPGLIVDRYGDYLVLQLLTQGVVRHADLLVDLLVELLRPRGIYERSDVDVRAREGLPPAEGLRWGAAPPAQLLIQTRSAGALRPQFYAGLAAGQKTGFYLDQALNRERVAGYCSGRHVLDAFCYTGGFAAYAAQAGATQLTAVDSSAAALDQLQTHMALNGLQTPVEAVEGNVFQVLRQYREAGRRFDMIILDPPKFAASRKQIERATRGYKDINLLAMQLLTSGGILATFSCSGLVAPDLFQKIVFGAALDARRDVQLIERLGQPPDHPVLLTFPESEYLKGMVCRVW